MSMTEQAKAQGWKALKVWNTGVITGINPNGSFDVYHEPKGASC